MSKKKQNYENATGNNYSLKEPKVWMKYSILTIWKSHFGSILLSYSNLITLIILFKWLLNIFLFMKEKLNAKS